MKPGSSRRLSDVLDADPGLAALARQARRSGRAAEAISAACRGVVPGFDPTRPGVCLLRGATLRLAVGSAPLAAKLRQAVPRMRSALHQQGFEGIEIVLCLQPDRTPYPIAAQDPRAHDPGPAHATSRTDAPAATPGMIGFAEQLAHTLEDSPLRRAVIELRSALHRAVARRRDREAQS